MSNNYSKIIIKSLSYIFIGLLFIMFSYWFLANELSELFPALFSVINIVTVCTLINQAIEPVNNLIENPDIKKYSNKKRPDILMIIFFVSIIWLLFLNVLLILFIKNSYPLLSLQEALEVHFSSFLDSSKFLFLSKNWYGNIENPEEYKNIFPLYSIIIKPFCNSKNVYIIMMLINTLLSSLSGLVFYNIALFDYDERTSLKAVIFLYLFPTSFFLILPLQLSLLFFLSLLYVYFIRKREWEFIFIIGFLLGLTDVYSLPLVLFAIIEFAVYIKEEFYSITSSENVDTDKSILYYLTYKNNYSKYFPYILRGFSLLSIPIGTIFFLLINKNSPINGSNIILSIKNFSILQNSYFFSNAFNLVYDFTEISSHDLKIVSGTFVPSIIIMAFILIILAFRNKKIRASYFIYSTLFFIIVFGQENILLASKYSCVLFTLPLLLATLTDNPILDVILIGCSFLLFLSYFILFLSGYPVY